MDLIDAYIISKEVASAKEQGVPVVALESTVITHGLPYPENFQVAIELEEIIRRSDCQPATVGVIDGQVIIGLDSEQIKFLSCGKELKKISWRDYASVVHYKQSGGTTVAGTMFAAEKAGIKVFSTGGIGGVHRLPAGVGEQNYDVSNDLIALANIPIVVVCAGAKAILDIPATLEILETNGIPVVGFQTDDFPAFYSISSGQKNLIRVDTEESVAQIAKVHWNLGFKTGILVTVPVPVEVALSFDEIEANIQKALQKARKKGITGQQVTPYLLKKLSQLSGGKSLRANLELLKNNAKVAVQIAKCLTN